jgi:hypothetical protein
LDEDERVVVRRGRRRGGNLGRVVAVRRHGGHESCHGRSRRECHGGSVAAVSPHAVGNGWGPRVVVRAVERGCCNTSSPFPARRPTPRLPECCRERACVITVVDPDAARRALLAGLLSCPEPGCDGVLRVWSRARTRWVRRLDGALIALRPDRARCRRCAVTQVLLPVWCVPRRGYGVEVVGAALLAAAEGAGHRRAAAGVQAPAGTVRGWLRAVRAGGPALTACAVELAQATGASVFPPGPPAWWAGRRCPGRWLRSARRPARSPFTCRRRVHRVREDP